MEAWITALALIVVAAINAATMIYVRRLEKNTNSKMDALVELTDTAAFARGKLTEQREMKTAGDR